MTEEKVRLDDLPDMLTVKQAADFLRLNFNTVKRLLGQGKLPGRKVGRQWFIDKDDLKRYLEQRQG
jgi:excisionase family DNA binding protein